MVVPADDAVALFYVDGAGRRAIKTRGAELVIGDAVRSVADLKAEALAHPERFSPNVLLRPVVQDRIFPTVCYVAGPAELAYQAQLGGVYREFGVEAPLLYSRASATLADGAAMRFLERSSLALETLHGQDDSVLNQWLANQLPAELERGIAEADTLVSERVDALKASVVDDRSDAGRRGGHDPRQDAGDPEDAARQNHPGRQAEGRHPAPAVRPHARAHLPRGRPAGAFAQRGVFSRTGTG
jgi:uncharacterized protein YllA (UPF0747 family)